jgi:hypothetical protein
MHVSLNTPPPLLLALLLAVVLYGCEAFLSEVISAPSAAPAVFSDEAEVADSIMR